MRKTGDLFDFSVRIVDALEEEMSGIKKMTIRIRKLNPPMGGPIKSVGIKMSRKQKSR